MRTIPQIRARLHELAAEHGLPELSALADETRRRPPVRRSLPRRRGGDEETLAQVRRHAERFPSASYHDIANACGTTIGRVSEALAGLREDA